MTDIASSRLADAKVWNVAADDENGHSQILCVDWMTSQAAEKVASHFVDNYVGKPYPNGKGYYTIANVRLIREAETQSTQSNVAGWQDISTAPKNTKVLAAYQNELGNWRILTACYHTRLDWSDEYGDHEEEFAPEDWYEESDSSEVIYSTSRKPTHWMPLPEAPLATTEGSDNG